MTERSAARVAGAPGVPVHSPADDREIASINGSLADLARLIDSPRVHERRVRGSGVHVSHTGLRCLTLVDQLGSVSVTRVATLLELSQATASRAMAQLENDGLLARTTDPGDGRVTYCTTTAAGRRALQRMQRFMYGQLTEALAGMPTGRRRDLASALAELVERLQAVPARGAGREESDL